MRRAVFAAVLALAAAGLLYVSFRDPEDRPLPVRTIAEVERRLAELGGLAEGHLPGRPVHPLAYGASTCPSTGAMPTPQRQARVAWMQIELRRGDDRLRALRRLRDALRAESWKARFPTEVKDVPMDILEAQGPDGYIIRVDGQTWDDRVRVNIDAPCFRLPER